MKGKLKMLFALDLEQSLFSCVIEVLWQDADSSSEKAFRKIFSEVSEKFNSYSIGLCFRNQAKCIYIYVPAMLVEPMERDCKK